MRLLCCFTLALSLAAAARADAPLQDDTPPDQNGPSEARSDTPDSDGAADRGDPDGDAPDDEDEEDAPAIAAPAKPDPDDGDDEVAPGGDPGKEDALVLEAETTTVASTRGEGAIDALVHASRGIWSGALGVGDGASTEASSRQWMRAQLGVNPGVALLAQALWEPPQSGSSQEQVRLSVGGETARGSWELALQQEDVQLSAGAAGLVHQRGDAGSSSSTALAMELSGGSISLEGAHALGGDPALRATMQLGAGAYSLTLPRSAATRWSPLAPWDRLGEYSLAWPARAQGELGLALEGNAGTLSAAIGAGLPAQAGGLEAELILAGEHAFGPLTLSLQLSAARLWPGELWLGSLSLGARLRFAG